MELREWLIILGLVLVTIIVVDGVRRLQRQRKVPRLDQVKGDVSGNVSSAATDPEEAAKQAEINWELPNGGARVVRPATQASVEPKPKLQRQEHPGPSKVFSRAGQTASSVSAGDGVEVRASDRAVGRVEGSGSSTEPSRSTQPVAEPQRPAAQPLHAERETPVAESEVRSSHHSIEPRPFMEDDADHHHATGESSRTRFSRAGMAAALRSGSQRVTQSMQRMSSAFQRHDDDEEHPGRPHREPSLGGAPDLSLNDDERHFGDERRVESRQAGIGETTITFEPPFEPVGETSGGASDDRYADDEQPLPVHDDMADHKVMAHPVVEKARRHHVSAQRARETLSHAEEVIVISVMARNEEGFSGPDLLDLMLACGLRYSEMGIFLRYETEDADSDLQFAMVDVVKPGTFDLEAMDDFATPGVTFLMPLPGAQDSAAAFEAMVETAMVLVRNMGGELKDENRSVMTAQTVGFARQRVQEFGRLNRLHRYQAT